MECLWVVVFLLFRNRKMLNSLKEENKPSVLVECYLLYRLFNMFWYLNSKSILRGKLHSANCKTESRLSEFFYDMLLNIMVHIAWSLWSSNEISIFFGTVISLHLSCVLLLLVCACRSMKVRTDELDWHCKIPRKILLLMRIVQITTCVLQWQFTPYDSVKHCKK